MRTIHELLIVLRDNSRVSRDGKYIDSGLCREVDFLHINDTIDLYETKLLNSYFRNNFPIKDLDMFSWPRGQWQPRLEWLNKHIELTKPNTTAQ